MLAICSGLMAFSAEAAAGISFPAADVPRE